ncbi:MAG: DUF4874 domain-containing protein [Lachnospiraceae bacterium]|nr:DUF4874 domain-containing protein [Lachnospiraceae bacterium]
MIKLLKKINSYRGFKKEKLKESTAVLNNPDRGWFSLYSFDIEEDIDYEKKFKLSDKENLVLVLPDIGAYKDKENIENALAKLENIINYFSQNGKSIILRVAYDHEGKGIENEPSYFQIVLRHAEQIADFVYKNRDKIFIYQGLLIGRWGEMHTSKFIDSSRIKELNSVFDSILTNTVYRAFRKPVQWRMVRFQHSIENAVNTANLGIFNDGMFGSESDLGTFDCTNKDTSWSKAWNRENETGLIGKIACTAPIGGEALYGEGFVARNNPDRYVSELSALRVTYLNGHYDNKLMAYWKNAMFNRKGIWDKSTYYEYIGAHLGYRFVIKNVEVRKSGENIKLCVEIENCGFADIYKETCLFVEISGDEGVLRECFDEKLNSCHPGERKHFTKEIKKVIGKLCIYADNSGNKRVYFANETVMTDGSILLGEIVK